MGGITLKKKMDQTGKGQLYGVLVDETPGFLFCHFWSQLANFSLFLYKTSRKRLSKSGTESQLLAAELMPSL